MKYDLLSTLWEVISTGCGPAERMACTSFSLLAFPVTNAGRKNDINNRRMCALKYILRGLDIARTRIGDGLERFTSGECVTLLETVRPELLMMGDGVKRCQISSICIDDYARCPTAKSTMEQRTRQMRK